MDKMFTYSVVQRIDPKAPDMPGKYYAQAQARGVANIREMSERIQQMCTVTRADVMAVLTALEDVVAECLANGEIVRLGDLCTLQVSLNGRGAETAKEFHEGLINKGKVIFRSGLTISKMLATLKYQKVEQKYVKKEDEETKVTGPEAAGEPGLEG